jgi:hypothetical protein
MHSKLKGAHYQRIGAHTEIKSKLDNLAIGGLHLEVIGLWWLLFATITTSVPDGVAWIARSISVHLP